MLFRTFGDQNNKVILLIHGIVDKRKQALRVHTGNRWYIIFDGGGNRGIIRER